MTYQEQMAEQARLEDATLSALRERESQELARDPKSILHAVFEMDTADSFATYVVEKVTPKTVTVKLALEDDYEDEILGKGGTFPRHKLENIILRQRA